MITGLTRNSVINGTEYRGGPTGKILEWNEEPEQYTFNYDPENNIVLSGVLAQTLNFHGVSLPAGTIIYRDEESGKITGATVTTPATYQGVRITNSLELSDCHHGSCPEGTIDFHPNGLLARAELVTDAWLGPLKFAGGQSHFNIIEFYPNGQLKLGTLAQNAIIDGQRYMPGNVLSFDEKGKASSNYYNSY